MDIIILTGIGAPISVYDALVDNLRERFTNSSIQVIAWWDEKDFGEARLKGLLKNSTVILIAHSAGGVVALKALVEFHENVKRVIMLDSHFLPGHKPFPSVEDLLKPMLENTSIVIKNQVMTAYQPVIENSDSFYESLSFCVDWISSELDHTGKNIKMMPAHTCLLIGLTDSKYKILDSAHEEQTRVFWDQYNIDTAFIPMTHFDFIDSKNAEIIIQEMIFWINLLERP